MNIVFFGTPEFAILPLKTILNSEHNIVAVVTQPDRQSGRGKHVSSCPVKIEAVKKGLKVIQPPNVRDTDFIDQLKGISPSSIIVVAYGQILPSSVLSLPKFGCINIHASLLPKYRGAAPINWAIINGEKTTGITTMLMDEGMDTGPILLQQETEIMPEDTAGSLSKRLSEIGSVLLLKTLEKIEKGIVNPLPQTGEPTYAPILKKTDGLIEWTRSAGEISNFIRGMNPWPGAYGFLQSERIQISKADAIDGNGEPGIICGLSKDELLVGTGRGRLSITEIQPAGKKSMSAKSFLQGRSIKEGMKIMSCII